VAKVPKIVRQAKMAYQVTLDDIGDHERYHGGDVAAGGRNQSETLLSGFVTPPDAPFTCLYRPLVPFFLDHGQSLICIKGCPRKHTMMRNRPLAQECAVECAIANVRTKLQSDERTR
jgi:hypothetical protein